MRVVHLTASTFYGGPERQILGLAEALRPQTDTTVLSFAEGGRCRTFIEEAHRRGLHAAGLRYDTPRLWSAVREVRAQLRKLSADVLCCHGYKANLLGLFAARQAGVPVLSVSRGWTGENFKVRCYETLDRFTLRGVDRVVCVSEGQQARVLRLGVPSDRTVVIRNSVCVQRFAEPKPEYRRRLLEFFATPPGVIVGAAGRLSPEKGFDVLITAATQVRRQRPDIGFVLFGDGALREALRQRIAAAGLAETFILAGFRADLDAFLPHLDLLVLPSYTEGLPNVVLEAFAARVPVVATAVGGAPEVVEDGHSGYLVPPGHADLLAERIERALGCERGRRALGNNGRARVEADYTFEAQAAQYRRLFEQVLGGRTDDRESVEHVFNVPSQAR